MNVMELFVIFFYFCFDFRLLILDVLFQCISFIEPEIYSNQEEYSECNLSEIIEDCLIFINEKYSEKID